MHAAARVADERLDRGQHDFGCVLEVGSIARAAAEDLSRAGLGLRLRYLSGGMSDEARTIERYVMPERSGYYLGTRMTDAAFSTRGAEWAVRASAPEISAIAEAAAATA